MARRRQKKRTHVKQSEEEFKSIPRSMVIHLGTALENHTLTQLVRDTRNMMQPHTAINLRERKSNKLKDFIVMAGPLGISYFMIFSQNEESGSTHLRLSSMPHGPTISFKILEYSLAKDINKILKTPKSLSKSAPEYASPPLLVMNGFTNPKDAEPQEKLIITAFQNMFPPINPVDTKVNTIKRVLLLNKDKETGIIDLRHYIIDTKLVDVNRGVKKLVQIRKKLNKKLPNLSKVQDVADIILDNGAAAQGAFTSDSEIEDDAVVEVEDDVVLTKPKVHSSSTANELGSIKRKKAIKLTEIGPRMKLDLVKIEQGVCAGKVLYHSQFKKSTNEAHKMDQRHAVRKKEKEARRKEQKARVAEKNEKKRLKKERRKARQAAGQEGSDADSDADSDSDADQDQDQDDGDMSDVPSDYSLDDGADNGNDKLFDEEE